MGKLVILSGPSCVGKGSLHTALRKLHLELAAGMNKLVLYNSRRPRPMERDGVDYYFRPRMEIERLKNQPRFLVLDVRGDLQALDLDELARTLAAGNAFFEGNPFVVAELLDSPLPPGAQCVSVFLSPLSRDEIIYLRAPARNVVLPDFIADVMRRKLLRRTKRQKTNLSLKDLEDIERRAGSAYAEMREAWRFDHVIVCHDGEDSENWDAFYYPLADARRALNAFVDILSGRVPTGAENWEEDLMT